MVQWEPPKDDAKYMLSYMLSSRLAYATSKVIEPKPLTDNDADEKPAKSLRGARYMSGHKSDARVPILRGIMKILKVKV